MQHLHYITSMIMLNESSLSGLVRTSVTNNWIVYQIVGAVMVKKTTGTINTSRCGWAAKTKRV